MQTIARGLPVLSRQTVAAGGASGNRVPPPLPTVAGLLLQLDATKITGLPDSAAVATWADASGNGYDATQSTPANQPVYKTNILNGWPVVRFDGGDYLDSNCPDDTDPVTIFSVVTCTNFSADRSILGASGSGGFQFRVDNTDGTLGNLRQGVNMYGSSSGALTAGVPVIVATAYSTAGGGSAWYINGQAAGTNPNTGALSSTTTIVGTNSAHNESWLGDFAEILKYSGILSDADRNAVFSYLNSKWAAYTP